MDKHIGSPSYKIVGTILKMDKGGTLANEPENKKIDNDAQSLLSER